MAANKGILNQLEVVKLAVAVLAVFLAAYLGYTFNSREHRESGLIEKRMIIYDTVGKNTNALFSYYLFVGKWRQYTPKDMIKFKRDTDEMMYTYQMMFSETLMDRYEDLMHAFFDIPGGWKEVRLRTQVLCRARLSNEWQPGWESYFTGEDDRNEVCTSYNVFMNKLAEELRLKELTGTLTPRNVGCPIWKDLSGPCS
jgi:hypothetical protein